MDNRQDEPTEGRKVLCIEDEHFISELYKEALTRAGYRFNIVDEGVAGLKEAQTNDYDIILLDIMMPNLTGVEILNSLRDPAQTPNLKAKVVIITNYEQPPDVKAKLEDQSDAFLVKAEMTPTQLVEILDNLS